MRVRLIHWNAREAVELADLLQAAGHAVELTSAAGSILKQIRAAVPDAVVIDLTRQPSHGREVAIAIRAAKTIKHLPILFVDGEPEKVEAVRRMLPDATFTSRPRLAAALKKARVVENPVRSPPMMERFGNRTTAQKLGITAGMRVAVVDPPVDYERVIGTLPEAASLEEHPRDVLKITLWFTHDPGSFLARLGRMRALAAYSRLWILWRKNKADGLDGGFIRVAGMEAGLVDYKICSLDAVWSGMVFAVRKTNAD